MISAVENCTYTRRRKIVCARSRVVRTAVHECDRQTDRRTERENYRTGVAHFVVRSDAASHVNVAVECADLYYCASSQTNFSKRGRSISVTELTSRIAAFVKCQQTVGRRPGLGHYCLFRGREGVGLTYTDPAMRRVHRRVILSFTEFR